MASQDGSSPLLAWYHSLTSRNVDLVGDFAGSNLGAIEGDSLLLLCFSDPDLDFRKGLQLLHAVFLVERFLKRLFDRRCHFLIMFVEQHRDLCIPLNALPEDIPKFLFAREVIIRHLKAHVEHSNCIKIWTSPTLDDSALRERLREEHVYFLLCHDGAGSSNEMSTLPKQVTLRASIRYSMSHGYYVALLNELKWKDSKIMIEVLENSWKAQSSYIGPDQMVQGACGAIIGSSNSGLGRASSTTAEMPKTQRAIMGPSDNSPGSPSDTPVEVPLSLRIEKRLDDEAGKASLGLRLVSCAIVNLRGITPINWNSLSQAFLLHHLLLKDIDLSKRRVYLSKSDETGVRWEYASKFQRKAVEIMTSLLSQSLYKLDRYNCDLADIIDGRVFIKCALHFSDILDRASPSVQNLHHGICTILEIGPLECRLGMPLTRREPSPEQGLSTKRSAVLRFSNSIISPHLRDVSVQIANAEPESLPAIQHAFRDLTHWHNRKKISKITPPDNISISRLNWRNQKNATEMATYAASLTNASGRILECKTILSKTQTSKSSSSRQEPGSKLQLHAGNALAARRSNKGSSKSKPSKKETFLEKIDQDKKAKATDEQRKGFDAWKRTIGQLDASNDPEAIEFGASRYLIPLSRQRSETVGNEVLLYRIRNLLNLWQQRSRDPQNQSDLNILALAVYLLEMLSSSTNLTLAEASCASQVAKHVGFPMTFKATSDATRKLSFDFNIHGITAKLSVPWYEFILHYYGPYMRRDLDSEFDERVPFEPDKWQRTVLDELDADKSVFVVAPTSSGKTFISFYAMEQVLKNDDDGILVYVAPTKALVNQIAAEVEGRFQKKYPHASKTAWAVHTRDYRVHDPARCQILITVPHILQIMLLSPENSVSWSSKIRRIIFDEIHTIGRAEDGLVWEQLLLLSPCPIIALSATVGNPDDFYTWLASTQESIGTQLTMIQHSHRYSDLRKFKYRPPMQFAFHSVPSPISKFTLSVDNDPCFGFVHPIGTLLNQIQLPEDLSLEPRDCFTLYQAICKYGNSKFSVPSELDPKNAIPTVPRKRDIFEWEESLKTLVREWMKDSSSPFQEVVAALSETMHAARQPEVVSGKPVQQERSKVEAESIDEEDMFQTTMPMLCSLQSQNALPAILFNYDRSMCDALCKHIFERLERSEVLYKATSSSWLRKIETWKSYIKASERNERKSGSQTKADKRKGNDDDDPRGSKSERMREDSELASQNQWASFDPQAPLDQFSFADYKKVEQAELQEFSRKLENRGVDTSLIQALLRGIAVHHAGCNRLYRHIVEMLFRRGFIRVVFATGTLALGINMPCVTTVFCGDSVFLTALEYRQAGGRAGRRGFDLLGNVIFHHIDDHKIRRLISSRLPDLSGHFPLTTTLVLRLLSLLENSENSSFAVQAVNSLLSQPRIYLGGDSYRHQVLHHLRFSIEYLRRNSLLSLGGAPQNFAGIVCHLYYTENAAFSFHALLRQGYFHELTKNVEQKPEHVLERLMLVLANIFGRRPFRNVTKELKRRPHKSPSVLFLPPLPPEARTILAAHDTETKEIFEGYVATFIDQHMQGEKDNVLPFSGLRMGGDKSYLPSLPATKVRSSFSALSGHGDTFSTVSELCNSVRSGVFLEEAVIPKLSGNREEGKEEQLNAYLYDFWKHQDLRALEEDNGIRKSEAWFVLNDFSLVLATIVTSLMSFVEGPVSDLDFLDLQGGGDLEEIDLDEAADDESSPKTPPQAKIVVPVQLQRKEPKKKKAVEESWEDEADLMDETEDEWEKKPGLTTDHVEGDVDEKNSLPKQNEGDLKRVLLAFKLLKNDFNTKFHGMWA
ncbi:hypothetical protein MMC10_009654 [Thelotrema lepadinum]|nr:hypothetical protein [Thelotrema lepadinum]